LPHHVEPARPNLRRSGVHLCQNLHSRLTTSSSTIPFRSLEHSFLQGCNRSRN
jgi:hypothetical protein